MAQPRFEVVQEDPQAAPDNALATQMLTIALGALSQRAVVALASLFMLVLAASVFVLFYTVLPQPTVLQLVGLGMYALFILALHIIKYRLK